MNFWSRLISSKPDEQATNKPLTLKERLTALGNLPPFFSMVWRTSRWMTIANAVLRIFRSATPLCMLYLAKLIIDQVIHLSRLPAGTSHQLLWILVGAEFGVAIISDVLSRAISLLDGLLGDRFATHTSINIMTHAATLDLDQFEDSAFYDKLERARQQTVGRTVLLSQVLSQVQDMITMLFLAAGLVVFNPWLIVLLLVAIIPAFLGESYFNDQNYALSRRQTPERRELDYIRYLGASDDTAKEIKIFNLSGFLINRFRELSDKFYNANRRISMQRFSWGTVFTTIGSAGYYSAYVVIIQQAVTGHLTIGALTFLAGSFRQLRSSLEGILTRFTSVSQGAVYLSDLFEFLNMKPRMEQVTGTLPFPDPVREGFTFEDVGFKYSYSDRWANRHLNFSLRPGEKLALVGENGAGKTTLVKLLVRLYDPVEGRILLDGVDLREYDLHALRRQTGIIFQDYLKYNMTIGENIAVGNIAERSNGPLIEKAAHLSLADTLAGKYENGYNQVLGRRFNQGVDLSGGEWQKIALARAYIRDAQLLILDEPTAALDARSEYSVFQRFAELTKGKTAVLISHRFSTVRMADRILVLDKGELVETGTHEELIRRDGHYAELFTLQAKGYR